MLPYGQVLELSGLTSRNVTSNTSRDSVFSVHHLLYQLVASELRGIRCGRSVLESATQVPGLLPGTPDI